MPWTAMQPVESPPEEPIFVRHGFRVATRRTDNCSLLGREDTLAECIWAITLMQRRTRQNRQASKEAETVLTENWGKFVALGPDTVLVVTKDDNTRLRARGTELLVLFEGEDTHCGNCPGSTFLLQSPILAQGDFPVSVELFDAPFLLKEALQPNVAIRVQISQCL
jgi:hypothetical protein